MNQQATVEAGTQLLAFVELGGYPNFAPLYQRLGYQVTTVSSGRKAQGQLKRLQPAWLVAEFNYQQEFRDRTSSLESLLAMTQGMPATRVLVIYEPGQTVELERLRQRFPCFEGIARPLDEQRMWAALTGPRDEV